MFDDPVLERVKRNDHDSAVGPEAANRRLEKTLELTEFVVDGNSQCLKGSRRRVDALFPIADHILYQTAELSGRPQGLLFATPDDRTGNRSGSPFLAVVA